jgi:hypothetical protein
VYNIFVIKNQFGIIPTDCTKMGNFVCYNTT